MSSKIDYYELLEVERTADGATIKSAYRKLAMQCHPDRNPGCKESEAKFKAINEAYDCLKDEQKRAAYDRFGHAAFEQGGMGGGRGGQAGFSDFSDIFETIFGDGFGGGGRQQTRRGADLRYDMEISLEDAFHGRDTTIEIDVSTQCDACDGSGAEPGTSVESCPTCGGHGKVRAQQGFFVIERTCPSCHGAGQRIKSPCRACRGEGRVDKRRSLDVKVPAGVDEGTRIRLTGQGEAGPRGAPAGDLYIFLHVKRHQIFERDGTNLFCRVPISFTLAALGGTIEVPGLDGEDHEIRIPAGIQSGKQLRQRGAGMPVLNARGRGDLVIQIEVETPTKLSARQKELLEEFRATETGEECPQSSGFFSKIKNVWSDLTE
ncbi:molecular chaperone DnaJ [Sphingobium sp. B1D7B]|uniref:molecular chaperone DnaJ n=1 Tax=unclassified Sphingobium TaxID=2611147 RepID=UPI002223F434|nr:MULTISPECIES: molecular chaperone DnaJ [unclassified Sphingobium]MCW2351002.1 molecular chaperone DnaJ [Sphingobium sp. B12D2B]MCW2370165.1 molecular chaperone DnaJ [Sphingobium sp. B11D3D]MCW2393360.1 molecular chaperone DnaJ [Sphingobium sp. B11D3A]MCW2405297.1 molecular chaperone DnaJ [Sphingobium sp. B1D7B]MCW2411477.1 molecular chaperone DnaJ [Sphingobium sp. B8D3D]